jgi:hypothetical protein
LKVNKIIYLINSFLNNIVNQSQSQNSQPRPHRNNSSQNGHIGLHNNTNNLLQFLNSSSRERNPHNQENSSSNQNETFNMSQSLTLNNRRLISLDNNINNGINQINQNNDNDANQNNININNNENNDFFFNNNFEGKLTQAHNCIITLLNNERKKIKESQESIEKMRADYNKYKKKELEKLDKEKNELKYLFKLYNNAQEDDILELCIGGTHQITTTRGTLIKYKNSALAVFFSGQHPLPMIGDKVFIDREGEQFINLVNFLRTGKFPIVKDKEEENKFKDELDFWKITLPDKSK